MWDGSQWWGLTGHKMADDKGPAINKVTEMTKISIKMANGGLPQGKKVIQGRKDKYVIRNHKF